jgi:hypothetical protein
MRSRGRIGERRLEPPGALSQIRTASANLERPLDNPKT